MNKTLSNGVGPRRSCSCLLISMVLFTWSWFLSNFYRIYYRWHSPDGFKRHQMPCLYIFKHLLFQCNNPAAHGAHKSSSQIITPEEGPGRDHGVRKDQSELMRLAGSADFWLALSANRLNHGEEVMCPGQWVVMLEMLAWAVCVCACICMCVCV